MLQRFAPGVESRLRFRRYVVVTLALLVLNTVASARDSADWTRYVPELVCRRTQATFPIHPTELSQRSRRGDRIESNWESYQDGVWGGEQPLGVSVRVIPGADPAFACDENLEGSFRIYQYLCYFTHAEKLEHDWAWVSVVTLQATTGEVPYAVVTGAEPDAQEESHGDLAAYFPGTGRSPLLRVVDRSHPELEIHAGNLLMPRIDGAVQDGNEGPDERIPWRSLQAGCRLEDGSLSFTSCAGARNEATHERGMARGDPAHGSPECREPMAPPWMRPEIWSGPVPAGRLLPPPAGSGLGCLAASGDCCSPGCTWARLLDCARLPFSGWGERPLRGSRPEGVFTSARGQRLIWSHWAPEIDSYRVVADLGSGRDTLGPQADSSCFLDHPGQGRKTAFWIKGYVDGQPFRVTRRAASRFRGICEVPVTRTLNHLEWVESPAGEDDRLDLLLATSGDGWLQIFRPSDPAGPACIAAYDLRAWNAWRPGYSGITALDARWRMAGGHRPPTTGASGCDSVQADPDRLMVALGISETGVLLLDATDPGAVRPLDFLPGDALDVSLTEDGLYWAAGRHGLIWCLLRTERHHPRLIPRATFSPEDLSGFIAETVGALEGLGSPAENAALCAFSGDEGTGLANRLYRIRIHRSSDGEWIEPDPPFPGPILEDPTDGDPLWELDDVDPTERLASLHDRRGSGIYSLLDLSVPIPRFLHAERNGLFRNGWAVDGTGSRTSLLLPGRRVLRSGSVPVSYAGPSPIINPAVGATREWGGLELYKDMTGSTERSGPLEGDDAVGTGDGGLDALTLAEREFAYLGAIAEDGFASSETPDVVATALSAGRHHGQLCVAVAWSDLRDDQDSSRTLTLYHWLEHGAPAPSARSGSGAAGAAVEGRPTTGNSAPDARVMPNPCRGAATIICTRGPGAAGGILEVCDVAGRRVRRLEVTDRGEDLRAVWDGRDDRGGVTGPGVYLVRWRSGGKDSTARLVKLP